MTEAQATDREEHYEGACRGPACITCSDEAVAVQVIELLDDDLARVATSAGPEVVSVALVDAGAGDTVLVHAGEALAVTRVPGPGVAV